MNGKRWKKSAVCSSLKAEDVIDNVDLLTEVLLRLPARSVLKFKCVSKQWYSIISDCKFVTNHTQLSPSPCVSGLYLSSSWHDEGRKPKPIPLENLGGLPSFFGGSFGIDDYSHGLFLVHLCGEGGYYYVVCNPTTQKYKRLPSVPEHDMRLSGNIVFFLSKALYKVVLSHYVWDGRYKFYIFSSDTAAWKIVKAPIQQFVTSFNHRSPTVYWEGAIHWMCGTEEAFHCKFDISEEKSEVVKLPPRPKILTPNKNRYFGESGGRLFLIQTRLRTATDFRVFEMGKGCSGWIVKFRFNLIDAFPDMECSPKGISVLYIMVGEKEKDGEILLCGREKVISYNFETNTAKVLSSSLPFPSKGFPFQASLATV